MLNRHVQNVVDAHARAETAYHRAAQRYAVALNNVGVSVTHAQLMEALDAKEAAWDVCWGCLTALRVCHVYRELAEEASA